MLRRAHELMAAGNYAAAAKAFETLARAGEVRGHPKTGHMFLQAGRARLLAGQNEAGFAHLKRGLELMVNHPVQLQKVGNRVIAELNERGMSAEAQEIRQWLQSRSPVQSDATRVGAAIPATARPILPTKCPECGGAVRADEADWIDDVTVECDYCGSPIRAEE
jgi:hypothetical protein